jgi:hypothetical protein
MLSRKKITNITFLFSTIITKALKKKKKTIISPKTHHEMMLTKLKIQPKEKTN